MAIYPSGTRIANRYEVVQGPQEKPGLAGGMGIVYLCVDHQEDRPVALKTFRPEYLSDRAARDRFLREGTAWVNLGRHPHIVRCYGVERIGDGREVYLVLELVAKEEGRRDASLRSWLAPGRPLPAERALLFALQIARGMAHATATIPGFVHRDLKPENVLVGADRLSSLGVNRVRVTDFGLVRTLGADKAPVAVGEDETLVERSGLTRMGGVLGTPGYMAPEQWGRRDVKMQADIYALGCILYEMLAGQRAVKGQTIVELEQAHCMGETQPLPADLPEAVGTVVEHCLSVKPAARYDSWGELERTLRTICEEVTGRAVSGPEPVGALKHAEQVATGWSYSAMAASYLDISKAEVAAEYFEQAVSIGRVAGEQQLIGAGLNGLGLAHRDLGKFILAADEIEQSLHIAIDLGDRYVERIALNNLGTCYRQLGKLKDALACHEEALCVARELGDQRGEAVILSSLGLLHEEMGQLDIAVRYHQQYLDTAHEIEDRTGEVGALINLGICHFLLGQTAEAISHHQQALGFAREVGDLRGEGRALAGLGQCYSQTNLEEAMRYLKHALSIAREVDDRQSVAGALGALALCRYQLGQLEEAERLAHESLEIGDETGNIRLAANACLLLARLMMKKRRFSEALCLAERAVQILARVGPVQQAQQAQQLVSRVQAMMR